ncbi:MAG: DUF1801 domain-containing protein [Planctomycetota bacterium]|nr:DUF1801 domain-containing protein [Planctomycetota bacterium]
MTAKKKSATAKSRRKTSDRQSRPAKKPATPSHSKPKLLSGGNPQIPKADGDAPVQAYIAAMPGWKHQVGRNLDDLIVKTIPKARKAVRWNTPFYGIQDNGWFLAFHCFDKYIKLTFFRGASLNPPPPVTSKMKEVRYFHIHEDEWDTTLDRKQLTNWIKQAAALPGEDCF